MMIRVFLVTMLLVVASDKLCAQQWTAQDSLRLQRQLRGEGELQLNEEALKQLEQDVFSDPLRPSLQKPWLDYDATLPSSCFEKTRRTGKLTLYPYTASTRYDWDPVREKKIKVDENTWRGPFYAITRTMPFANVTSPSGMDFMALFTRDFWNFKGRKRRKETLRVLSTYGDSITAKLKQPVWVWQK